MLLLAAALLLSGCNSEAGSQENGKSQEVVEASDLTDKTDSFVKDSEEGVEVSTDVVEATDSTIPESSTETVAGSGEIQNSKKFEDYWDHENNAFDLKEYLESTNPYKLSEYSDSGIIDDYCVMYGTKDGQIWGVEISSYIIVIYDVCAVDQHIPAIGYDLFSTDITNVTAITLNRDGFTMTDRNVSSIEIAIKLAMQAVEKSDAKTWIKEQLEKEGVRYTEKEFY